MSERAMQIRETADQIRRNTSCYISDAEFCAELLYEMGYRKQREGEWKIVYRNKTATVYECTVCGHLDFATSDYCVCGAKMKGE